MQKKFLTTFFGGHFWMLSRKTWAGFRSVSFMGPNGWDGGRQKGGPTPPGNPQSKKCPFSPAPPCTLNIVLHR